MKITVDVKRCPQNHPCPAVKVCPVGAITQKGFDAPLIEEEKCIACENCVMFCPMGALQAK